MVSFPRKYLYADPDNKVYDALDLVKSSPLSMITDIKTPLSIAKRFQDSKSSDLKDALKNWKPWIPPKLEQGLQQGGAFVFEGYSKTLFARKDPATGDHVNLNEILNIALH